MNHREWQRAWDEMDDGHLEGEGELVDADAAQTTIQSVQAIFSCRPYASAAEMCKLASYGSTTKTEFSPKMPDFSPNFLCVFKVRGLGFRFWVFY